MSKSNQPNIIIFNPDQMRADTLAHLGNTASHTPNLDAFAQEGVSFSNAYCQNPVCVPSRCSFMTGLYPHTSGHRTMAHLLHEDEGNLFSDLKEEGYYTVSSARGDLMAGQETRYHRKCVDEYITLHARKGQKVKEFSVKAADNPQAYNSFYDGIIPTNGADEEAVNMDDLTVDGAIRSIRHRPKNKPLFMFLALNFPHPPYQIEQKYYQLINKEGLQKRIPSIADSNGKPSMEMCLRDSLAIGEDQAQLDEIRMVYLAMCAKVDYQFGRILSALKEEGIYDDTAVLFFSDHGDYTGDYGLVEKAQNCFPDCLVNVPLLIKPNKGHAVDCGVNDNLVELADICATCHSLAGITPKRALFGSNLLTAVANKSVALHDWVFCEGGRLAEEAHCAEAEGLVTVGRYTPRLTLQGQIPQHTKATMVRNLEYKYVMRLYEKDEFYCLKDGESVNQIDNAQYAPQIEECRGAMLNWYQRTCDTVPVKPDDRFTVEFINNLIYARGIPRFVGGLLKLYLKVARISAGEFVNRIRKKYGI